MIRLNRDGGVLNNPTGVLVSFLGTQVLCGTAQFVGGVFGVGFTLEQCAIAQAAAVCSFLKCFWLSRLSACCDRTINKFLAMFMESLNQDFSETWTRTVGLDAGYYSA